MQAENTQAFMSVNKLLGHLGDLQVQLQLLTGGTERSQSLHPEPAGDVVHPAHVLGESPKASQIRLRSKCY